MSTYRPKFPPPQGIVPGGIPLPSWTLELSRPPRYFGDNERHRMMRQRIDAVAARDGTWGFALVRVHFQDDGLFENAVQVLQRVVEHRNEWDKLNRAHEQARALEQPENHGHPPVPVDTKPNDEFLSRFRLDLLEDRSMQDASVQQVQTYFNQWLQFVGRPQERFDTRYRACIMMDKETMQMLGQLPADFPEVHKTYFRSDYCVKMVEGEANPAEAYRVHLLGEDSLVEYWFQRILFMRPIENSTGYADEDGTRVLYYGSMWKRKPRQRMMQPLGGTSVV